MSFYKMLKNINTLFLLDNTCYLGLVVYYIGY